MKIFLPLPGRLDRSPAVALLGLPKRHPAITILLLSLDRLDTTGLLKRHTALKILPSVLGHLDTSLAVVLAISRRCSLLPSLLMRPIVLKILLPLLGRLGLSLAVVLEVSTLKPPTTQGTREASRYEDPPAVAGPSGSKLESGSARPAKETPRYEDPHAVAGPSGSKPGSGRLDMVKARNWYTKEPSRYDNPPVVAGPSVSKPGRSSGSLDTVQPATDDSAEISNSDSTAADVGNVFISTECFHCLAIFPTYTALEAHCRNIHPRTKPYKCDLCVGTYMRSRALRQHRRRHKQITKTGSSFPASADVGKQSQTDVFLSFLTCPHCSVTFPRHTGLRAHCRDLHTR